MRHLRCSALPADIARKVEAACAKSVADERFQTAARNSSQEPLYRNAEEFGRFLAADFVSNRDVVRNAKLPTQ